MFGSPTSSLLLSHNPSSARFGVHLPQAHSSSSNPRPYRPTLTPAPSPLRPHCLARDRIRLWCPANGRSTLDASGLALPINDADLSCILAVVGARWELSTKESYGAGLLVYHVWCNLRGVLEGQRCPMDRVLLVAFIAACASTYSGSALRNIVYGIRAWHIVHGQQWSVDNPEVEAVLEGASRLAPANSCRMKRAPWTVTMIERVRGHLNLALPLDAAVFACLTSTFWSASRLGEMTVSSLTAFNPSKHIKVSDVSPMADRHGANVTVFHLPRTKCSSTGEDVFWAVQTGPADPSAAYQNHILVNNPSDSEFLFSYLHKSGRRRPLTRTAFLARIGEAAAAAGLEIPAGHGLRIGAVLEYLLRGVPFDVVKSLGRWSSDAFVLYLRQHAVIIAPYIQDTPLQSEFVRYTMPPTR